jgi:hypothetical protein
MKRSLAVGLLLLLSVCGVASAQTPVARLLDQVNNYGVWTNTDSYTPVIYEIPTTSPCLWTFTVTPASAPLQARFNSVLVPCFFLPSQGVDGEAVVLDATNNKTTEFFQARWDNALGWLATWGGSDVNANFVQSPFGAAYGRAWARPNGVPYGTQASGIAFVPGVIRVSELQAGVIPHAVQISARWSCSTWKAPATRTDTLAGNNPATRCLQYGQLFKLPQNVNISGLPPFPRMIAQAAKTYGIVVTDQTLGTVTFRAENWKRKVGAPPPSWGTTDPYFKVGGYFGCDGFQNGQPATPVTEYDCSPDSANLFSGFPWSSLTATN